MVYEILGYFILFMFFVGCCLIWFFQIRLKRQIENHHFCTFISQGGSRTDKLEEVDGNEIIVRKPNKVISRYYTSNKKSWTSQYPLGRPKLLQVTVKSSLYAEGNPEPLDPFELEPIITSDLLGSIMDVSFGKVLAEEARKQELGEDVTKKTVQVSKFVYIGFAGVFVMSLVLVFVTYMSYGNSRDSAQELKDLETKTSVMQEQVQQLYKHFKLDLL